MGSICGCFGSSSLGTCRDAIVFEVVVASSGCASQAGPPCGSLKACFASEPVSRLCPHACFRDAFPARGCTALGVALLAYCCWSFGRRRRSRLVALDVVIVATVGVALSLELGASAFGGRHVGSCVVSGYGFDRPGGLARASQRCPQGSVLRPPLGHSQRLLAQCLAPLCQ